MLSQRSTVKASASSPAVITVAMAASSSTSSARLVISLSSPRHRQMHAKVRPSSLAVVADAPVHVGDQLAHQRQAEALAVLLAGHERFEDRLAQRGIDAGAIVADADLDRQLDRPAKPHDAGHEAADEAGL